MLPKLGPVVVLLFAAIAVIVSLVVADDASDEQISAVAKHMHDHLEQVIAIKAAVIDGNLAGVRAPANRLADHDSPAGLPAMWLPFEEEMRNLARVAATAATLETAAATVSGIGQACGDCHLASGFAVSFGYANPPPDDQDSTVSQMQRHLWASDRMWAGLIGPSDAAWERGTVMLSEVNLKASNLTKDPRNQPRVEELIQEARAVGARGAEAMSTESRTVIYGEFLSLCANCHSLTGGGPHF